ncbi:GerMN domain-containing protein [Sporomusa acidovorans]|uniref:GerMN domain-containing protein n=1 Tax=Sporomusa acidovorans (strain ATCC 49682 / DSM 3132 / Mol) TaxID=1123286 RepID=A0ABZ3IZQ8_SPOA4|nr:GerMN domain-containing protein [Sporomusa acidovorans]OZC19167.1 lipoprotein LpqB [Sporomusa acidovorans DSM 3132]SDF11821.1 Sporulation and spore germination [Sporomusa acidovorans]
MKTIRLLITAALMIVALGITGCDSSVPAGQQTPAVADNKASEQSQSGQNTVSVPGKTMQLVVYYATKDAMYLVPEIHKVPVNSHPARTAIELLLAGTKNPELVSVVPEGAQLRKLSVKDHIAYADFNEKLIKKNGGGSTSEILLVGAIVNTLTEFPDIQQVQILVNGKKIETISGHMDTSEPLSRSEKIIKK